MLCATGALRGRWARLGRADGRRRRRRDHLPGADDERQRCDSCVAGRIGRDRRERVGAARLDARNLRRHEIEAQFAPLGRGQRLIFQRQFDVEHAGIVGGDGAHVRLSLPRHLKRVDRDLDDRHFDIVQIGRVGGLASRLQGERLRIRRETRRAERDAMLAGRQRQRQRRRAPHLAVHHDLHTIRAGEDQKLRHAFGDPRHSGRAERLWSLRERQGRLLRRACSSKRHHDYEYEPEAIAGVCCLHR